MRYIGRIFCAATALLILCPALAEEMPVLVDTPIVEDVPATEDTPALGDMPATEDMPIVVDEAFTEAELAQMAAERADALKEAQQLLIDLGYLTGAADGILGPRSVQAIKDFQTRKGLEVTGAMDDETLAALREMAETVADAKLLQQRMVDLGYMRGKVDGIFGERSQKALLLFQAMNGLEINGKADEPTRAALFAEDAKSLPGRLSGGDRGERVEALQARLIQFGFLTGEADGTYGPKTSTAVTRFQNHLLEQGIDPGFGIEATGEATPATQALLLDPEYSSYIYDIAPGATGSEAARVENKLYQLGYMDLEPNDTFDDYAQRAARAFKEASGLSGDALDRDFFDALFALDAPQAEHYVPHAIAYGDRGQAVRSVEKALLLGGLSIKLPNGRYDDLLKSGVGSLKNYLNVIGHPQAELFADESAMSEEAQDVLAGGILGYRRIVFPGESSAETVRVQSRLHTLYYLEKKDIDGNFGEVSVEAVKSFQEANGLPATGIADEATQAALFSEEAKQNPRPYRVEVDIDHQRVYIFERTEDGEYEQTHTFICSTGLGNATPRGVFLDGFPVNYWHHFREFDCWAKYSFEVEGNIMFHSVLFSKNDESTLREGSLYALGQKASHGCIRLNVADAKWLYEHCKRGSLVIVIY